VTAPILARILCPWNVFKPPAAPVEEEADEELALACEDVTVMDDALYCYLLTLRALTSLSLRIDKSMFAKVTN